MNIGIIGGGNVGGTLCTQFQGAGHEVKVGVPDTGEAKYAALPATTPEEAASFGEVVFFATPWSATESAASTLKPQLGGKAVVDCTNPINADFSGLLYGHNDSAGQHIARLLPNSHVVKAFNTIGFNIMASPAGATLLVAGDDAAAKTTVMQLGREIGFDPVDVGGISMAAYTEAFAWVWITLAVKNGRDFSFNIVKR